MKLFVITTSSGESPPFFVQTNTKEEAMNTFIIPLKSSVQKRFRNMAKVEEVTCLEEMLKHCPNEFLINHETDF